METRNVSLTVLSPRGMLPKIEQVAAARSLSGLSGKKIGILNNTKSGGDEILSYIEKTLRKQIPDIELRTWRVPVGLSPDSKKPLLEQIAEYSDGVFALMGD